MHKVVALLPLKAHSERVPGKNFKEFCGKPLFRWMLDELLSMREVEQVIINTDAPDLLHENGLPKDQRILLRERPEKIRGDFVSMNRIIADDLEAVESELYLQTHVTNPLLSAATVRSAINAISDGIAEGSADSLFSVTRHQSRFYWGNGSPVNHDPEELVRTQDLDPLLEENSNIYLFTKTSFLKTGARIGVNPMMLEVPRLESIDIDDVETWRVAEALASIRTREVEPR